MGSVEPSGFFQLCNLCINVVIHHPLSSWTPVQLNLLTCSPTFLNLICSGSDPPSQAPYPAQRLSSPHSQFHARLWTTMPTPTLLPPNLEYASFSVELIDFRIESLGNEGEKGKAKEQFCNFKNITTIASNMRS